MHTSGHYSRMRLCNALVRSFQRRSSQAANDTRQLVCACSEATSASVKELDHGFQYKCPGAAFAHGLSEEVIVYLNRQRPLIRKTKQLEKQSNSKNTATMGRNYAHVVDVAFWDYMARISQVILALVLLILSAWTIVFVDSWVICLTLFTVSS